MWSGQVAASVVHHLEDVEVPGVVLLVPALLLRREALNQEYEDNDAIMRRNLGMFEENSLKRNQY
jgi:hypothetical protein